MQNSKKILSCKKILSLCSSVRNCIGPWLRQGTCPVCDGNGQGGLNASYMLLLQALAHSLMDLEAKYNAYMMSSLIKMEGLIFRMQLSVGVTLDLTLQKWRFLYSQCLRYKVYNSALEAQNDSYILPRYQPNNLGNRSENLRSEPKVANWSLQFSVASMCFRNQSKAALLSHLSARL